MALGLVSSSGIAALGWAVVYENRRFDTAIMVFLGICLILLGAAVNYLLGRSLWADLPPWLERIVGGNNGHGSGAHGTDSASDSTHGTARE